jgi:hypothetical protein
VFYHSKSVYIVHYPVSILNRIKKSFITSGMAAVKITIS